MPGARLRLRVEAAVLEARGDQEAALAKLGDFEQALQALPDQALRTRLQRLLERWRSELPPPR